MALANGLPRLTVLGVHLKSEGYPNTLFRLQQLEACGRFELVEINWPMWSAQTRTRGLARFTRSLWQALAAHLVVLLRFLLSARSARRVYIPYPSVFVLFVLSCLPKRLRPEYLVADVFISLFDTIVLDRKLLAPRGFAARMLKRIEKRAYAVADRLVVDTPQNAKYLAELFDLPEAKLLAVPLATDEQNFRLRPYTPSTDGCCRVLFVGTLVPLHGVETILEAAGLLSGRKDIRFRLIGDGQDAPLVEAWLARYPGGVEWERAWQSSSALADEIARADICLGIFGAGDKTQRVCPFKVYAYAAMGRAVLTGETRWLRETAYGEGQEAFAGVPVNNPQALAASIAALADDAEARTRLSASAHRFYEQRLANRIGLEALLNCLLVPAHQQHRPQT